MLIQERLFLHSRDQQSQDNSSHFLEGQIKEYFNRPVFAIAGDRAVEIKDRIKAQGARFKG
jgi:hypothetical protein